MQESASSFFAAPDVYAASNVMHNCHDGAATWHSLPQSLQHNAIGLEAVPWPLLLDGL